MQPGGMPGGSPMLGWFKTFIIRTSRKSCEEAGGSVRCHRPPCVPHKSSCYTPRPPPPRGTPTRPHLLQAGGVELRLVNDFHGNLDGGARRGGSGNVPRTVPTLQWHLQGEGQGDRLSPPRGGIHRVMEKGMGPSPGLSPQHSVTCRVRGCPSPRLSSQRGGTREVRNRGIGLSLELSPHRNGTHEVRGRGTGLCLHHDGIHRVKGKGKGRSPGLSPCRGGTH